MLFTILWIVLILIRLTIFVGFVLILVFLFDFGVCADFDTFDDFGFVLILLILLDFRDCADFDVFHDFVDCVDFDAFA